ncbi:Dabb family protein [Gordonia sp. PDNC005]|uniref:Dabb family protein n=1 Tax=unclassified Gordonia (in: high G+C Gram-positive bacteria) TaxID=2657482 RepID=UPI001965921F|nr:Dabb family protein [Gordonia sp. PDNC005]QRY62667.1 Dabb family protein [Gordonia sp. PDNC005]
MSEMVRLIHLHRSEDVAAVVRRLRGVVGSDPAAVVQPTHRSSLRAGDVLLRCTADSAVRTAIDTVLADDGAVLRVDGADFDGGVQGSRVTDPTAGVYRALLLRVEPGTAPDVVARFERETLDMPTHISSILAWRLSRVEDGSSWTHVWEQWFTDTGAVVGQYMLHPVHWARIDRWFDPECPDVIVRAPVIHAVAG